jgi:hypothetical protein
VQSLVRIIDRNHVALDPQQSDRLLHPGSAWASNEITHLLG